MGGIAGGGGGKGGGGGGGGGGGDAFGLDTGGGGSFGGGGFSDPMSGLNMGSGGGDIGPIGGSFDDPSTIFANPLVGASESMGGGGPAQALASMGGGGGGEFTGGDTGQQPSGAPPQQQGQSQQPTFVQPPQPPQQQAAAPSPNAPQSAGWFTTPAQAAEYRPDFNQTFGQFPTEVPATKGDLLSIAGRDQPLSFADRFSPTGATQASPAVQAPDISSGALSFADPTSPAYPQLMQSQQAAQSDLASQQIPLPQPRPDTAPTAETATPATTTADTTPAATTEATPDTTVTNPQTGTPQQAGRQQQRQVSPIQAIIDLLSGKPQGLKEISEVLKGMGKQSGTPFSPNLQDLNRQVGNDYGAPGGPMAQGQTPGAREPVPAPSVAEGPSFTNVRTPTAEEMAEAPKQPIHMQGRGLRDEDYRTDTLVGQPQAKPEDYRTTAAPEAAAPPDDILAGSQHEGGYGLTPETIQETAPTGAGTREIAPATVATDQGAPPATPSSDAGPTLPAMAPGMSQVPIPLRRPPGAPQPTAPTTAWPPQPSAGQASSLARTPLSVGRQPGQISYANRPIRPPSQPSVDRSQFRNQMNDKNIYKLAWMINGEVGRGAPLQAKIVQAETAFNRAQMRNDTIDHSLMSKSEGYYRNPRGYNAGPYYEGVSRRTPGTYRNNAKPSAADIALVRDQILPAILNGSNLSDVGYGPMTGNASAGVAGNQFRKGTFGYRMNGGDTYFSEGPIRRLPTNDAQGQPTAQQPGTRIRTDQLPRQHVAALQTGNVNLPGGVPAQPNRSQLQDLINSIPQLLEGQSEQLPEERPMEYPTLPGSPRGTPYDFGIPDALVD